MTLRFITILLGCQLAGEVTTRGLDVAIPGPVLGMAFLFVGLVVKGEIAPGLAATAGGLLDHLALLFVPAGVGVIVHLPLLSEEYPALIAALVGSTFLTIVVTAVVMSALARPGGGEDRS